MKVWAWRQHKHTTCVHVSIEEPIATYGHGGRDYFFQADSILVCRKVWRKLTGSGGTIKPSVYNLLGWRHR